MAGGVPGLLRRAFLCALLICAAHVLPRVAVGDQRQPRATAGKIAEARTKASVAGMVVRTKRSVTVKLAKTRKSVAVKVASSGATAQDKTRRSALAATTRTVAFIGGAADRAGNKLKQKAIAIAGKKGKQHWGARSFDFAGRVLVTGAGTETLRNTSFNLELALVVTIPALQKFANAHLYVAGLLPSVAQMEKGMGSLKLIDFGTGIETMVGGLGTGRRSGKWFGVNLPYVAPWVGERAWGATIGLPYVAALGIGRYTELGPFVSTSTSLPLAGLFHLGLATALFYPPLEPVIEKLQPYVEKIQRIGEEILGKAASRTARLRSRFKRAQRPHVVVPNWTATILSAGR